MRNCFWSILFAIILFISVFADEDSYISADDFIKSYGFENLSKNESGICKITKSGTEIKFMLGSNIVLINNEAVKLSITPKSKDSKILLPKEIIQHIEKERYAFHSLSEISQENVDKPKLTPLVTQKRRARILIDPGHGGKYDGAKGLYGLIEKNLNLDIARKLEDILKDDFDVFMTRYNDSELSKNSRDDLEMRCKKSRDFDADIFVSIHCNWEKTYSVEGFEIYISRDEDKYERERRYIEAEMFDEQKPLFANGYGEEVKKILRNFVYNEYQKLSRALAEEIRSEFKVSLPSSDRGIKEAGFYVLKGSYCPAVLIETDFVSSIQGASRLSRDSYKQKLAESIARAIKSFLKKHNF